MIDITDEDDPPAPSVPAVDASGRLDLLVDDAHAGERLDRFLGRALAPQYSRSFLAALVEQGAITVDGEARRTSFRLSPSMRIEGQVGRSAAWLPQAEPLELAVLHEDEAVIVVDKAAGMVIHPGAGKGGQAPARASGLLVNAILHRYPEVARVGRADRPGIVHRLDKETSGVMVVARSNEAARELVLQFKAKTVEKEYAALVWGEMPFDSDWIDLPMGTDPRRPPRMAVLRTGGRPASTFYETRERLGVATLVAAFPRTGRTHQIRVHLAHLGFPIVGDPTYGQRAVQAWTRWSSTRPQMPRPQRHMLHARRLSFRHPLTGARVSFEAPLPRDMHALLEALRAEAAVSSAQAR